MKLVRKTNEPVTLAQFRNATPNAAWNDMREDPHFGGMQAYSDCRTQVISDQGGLCAYCEIDILDNDPLKCRVEHFHPKSDLTGPRNWALDWPNMLGVCNGGSNPHVAAAGFHLAPLAQNLSCDAHKDRQIQASKLPPVCEGWILNPLTLQAFQCLLKISRLNGSIEPDPGACQAAEPWPNNQHASVVELVQHTIDMLNLNCDRLKKSRLTVIRDIEQNKKRQRSQGFNGAQGMENLTQYYFRRTWPGFFTVIRVCLGQAAENHLQSHAYQG